MKTCDACQKLWKLLAGGLCLLLVKLSVVPMYNPNRWPCSRLFSSISVIIAGHDGLLPMITEYQALSYFQERHIAEKTTFKMIYQWVDFKKVSPSIFSIRMYVLLRRTLHTIQLIRHTNQTQSKVDQKLKKWPKAVRPCRSGTDVLPDATLSWNIM